MILITRPKTKSSTLAFEFKKRGYQTVEEPLSKFFYYKNKLNFKENKVYIVTSIQAALSLIKYNTKIEIRKNYFAVVGQKTKQCLQKNGAHHFIECTQDGISLVKKLDAKKYKNNEYIYLCSNINNTSFVNELSKKNIKFKTIKIYRTTLKKRLRLSVQKQLQCEKFSHVVFYSSAALKSFLQLIKKHKIDPSKLNDILFICLSMRIAGELKKTGYKYKVSQYPDEKSILSLFNSALNY